MAPSFKIGCLQVPSRIQDHLPNILEELMEQYEAKIGYVLKPYYYEEERPETSQHEGEWILPKLSESSSLSIT